MFVVLVYDINHKRVGKVLKTCRKYLVRVQRSVFEGRISESKLERSKKELDRIINVNEDTICIYKMDSVKYILKEQIGIIEDNSKII